ncbi:hypothetical protein BCR44DRAFT_1427642 [Catenaria anguillulae PL171]|uniref:Uncharacterized protein n=1 Tax=Catenaria anguillulae PL171 TaxID=765915 RepID=A0A1Y2HVS2_9FUNG|nr:hypothetical protein BCR44DRAFT_1427642 [Catenaria anguillulae PL171]
MSWNRDIYLSTCAHLRCRNLRSLLFEEGFSSRSLTIDAALGPFGSSEASIAW